MAKLDDPKFGGQGSFPALKPEDLDGDLVEVTIAAIEDVDFGGENGKALVLVVEEIEGKKLRLNSTSRKRLRDGGITDTDDAVGKRIALEVVRTNNPNEGGRSVKSVWVAEPSEWPSSKRAKVAKRRK